MGHIFDRDKITAVDETLNAERIIWFLSIGRTDMCERMLDVWNHFRPNPDVDESVEESIKPEDVNESAKTTIELLILGILVLRQVWSGGSRLMVSKGSLCIIFNVSCVHYSCVEICTKKKQAICGVRCKDRTRLHLVHNDAWADGKSVTAVISVNWLWCPWSSRVLKALSASLRSIKFKTSCSFWLLKRGTKNDAPEKRLVNRSKKSFWIRELEKNERKERNWETEEDKN